MIVELSVIGWKGMSGVVFFLLKVDSFRGKLKLILVDFVVFVLDDL